MSRANGTVLNIGINDVTVSSFTTLCNKWFALDLQKTFLQQFGTVVLGLEPKLYEDILWKFMKINRVESIRDLPTEVLEQVIFEFKRLADVPSDPYIQLEWAVEALFRSWHTERCVINMVNEASLKSVLYVIEKIKLSKREKDIRKLLSMMLTI